MWNEKEEGIKGELNIDWFNIKLFVLMIFFFFRKGWVIEMWLENNIIYVGFVLGRMFSCYIKVLFDL